jgi:hemolysin activation/secretion protein
VSSYEEIRKAITNLYVRSGYVTSGAYLPLQDLSDGTVVVQVVEGQLEKIEIRGLDRLQESYVRDRFREASQPPLKVDRISEALQLLEFNPLFQRVRADLKEGTSPGLSVLVVELKEAPAFSLGWQFDNYESPAIGEYKGTIFIEHQNLLGFGDRLSASYSLTEGLDKYEIGYKIPFNAKDGTIEVEYNSGDNRIVEKFEELGIRAESDRFSVLVRQPLVKRSTEEIALFFSVDLQESRTFILEDIPFSFTEGSEEGKSRVTALRLGQEWISRSSNRVLAARSQFSVGLDWFEATTNDSAPDGRFFSWQGQFQWVEKLDEDVIFLLRVATQLTPDSLLPIEQFTLGGINTVRGYRQNLRVGDNALTASSELQFTLVRDEDWGNLEIAPFVDFGTVWNNESEVLPPNTIVSTGLSLRWQLQDYLFVRLDYGIPLVEVENEGDSLQEDGLSFSVGTRVRF